MDFDLVIQGPLDKTSIDQIDQLSHQFNNIIVSHWSENDSSLLNNIQSKNVVICNQPTPDLQNTVGVMKDSTLFYSISSTFYGLQRCKSKYVIKMRSDEFYENLSPLKEKLIQGDTKLVFGNIFAKARQHSHFHIGDHLFASKLNMLLDTYSLLYNAYYGSGNGDIAKYPWLTQGHPSKNTAESILAIAFICSNHEINNNTKNKTYTELFLDNFDVIDINLLGRYVACWKHAGIKYTPDRNRFVWNVKEVGDMV